jgi:hypothetical protein
MNPVSSGQLEDSRHRWPLFGQGEILGKDPGSGLPIGVSLRASKIVIGVQVFIQSNAPTVEMAQKQVRTLVQQSKDEAVHAVATRCQPHDRSAIL